MYGEQNGEQSSKNFLLNLYFMRFIGEDSIDASGRYFLQAVLRGEAVFDVGVKTVRTATHWAASRQVLHFLRCFTACPIVR